MDTTPRTPEELLSKLIDAELTDGVVPSEAAARIVATMEQAHAEELRAWMAAQATRLIAREIADIMRSNRHRVMARRGAIRFRAAIESADDVTGLYDTWHTVNEENARRRLADMTGADHAFAADAYRASASASLMREAFHRVLARRVGDRRTADVLPEEECQRILDGITKPEATGRVA